MISAEERLAERLMAERGYEAAANGVAARPPSGARGGCRCDARGCNPNLLRILVVMATQPAGAEAAEVHRVVNRVREMALVFAAFDRAFVAKQVDAKVSRFALPGRLPGALMAVHRNLRARQR